MAVQSPRFQIRYQDEYEGGHFHHLKCGLNSFFLLAVVLIDSLSLSQEFQRGLDDAPQLVEGDRGAHEHRYHRA